MRFNMQRVVLFMFRWCLQMGNVLLLQSSIQIAYFERERNIISHFHYIPIAVCLLGWIFFVLVIGLIFDGK